MMYNSIKLGSSYMIMANNTIICHYNIEMKIKYCYNDGVTIR